MTIVFVVDYFGSETDGTVITAKRFKEELERRGHTVRVLSYGVNGENEFGLSEHYIPVVSKFSKKFNVTYAKFDKRTVFNAFKDADLAHLFLPFQLQRKALKLAKLMGVPVCSAFHVHPENILRNAKIKSELLSKFIFWYFKKIFYSKVQHIHCPTEFTANELKKHNYGANLYVISNGASPEFKPCECETNSEKDYFDILMVGRFAHEKRQDLLIEAVKRSQYKDKIRITFAGSGPLEEKLKEDSSTLPNPPVFKFLNQNELIDTIYNSDLYVHGADVEIEGISCIEAFSCGLVPLISNAKLSATKNFALDPRSLFEAGNAENLKEKIEYWIENPSELALMRSLYARHGENFSLSGCVDKAEAMFKSAHNAQRTAQEDMKTLRL
ncbi:MAG: glycosyltransferase [Firmicutes bacterium]|nr:glycosyltransferase [Bacillota bacterium]